MFICVSVTINTMPIMPHMKCTFVHIPCVCVCLHLCLQLCFSMGIHEWMKTHHNKGPHAHKYMQYELHIHACTHARTHMHTHTHTHTHTNTQERVEIDIHCLVSILRVFHNLGLINENAFLPASVEGSGSCMLPAVAPRVTQPVSIHGQSKGYRYEGFIPRRVL